MGKTYQKLMNDLKSKKWGLSKRFQYDLVKPTMGESKLKNSKYDEEVIIEEH